jgi:hypothetical protein
MWATKGQFLVPFAPNRIEESSERGLCLPQPRTNSMKNSFMYDGAKLWNSIPNEIRESQSLSSFQKKIAAHIF